MVKLFLILEGIIEVMHPAYHIPKVLPIRNPRWAMVWLFVAISYIGLISSRPSLDLKGCMGMIKKLVGSSSPQVQMDDRSTELSSKDYFTTDLDGMHTRSVLEQQEHAPYFWENKSYKSNAHLSLTIPQNGESITERAQTIKHEWKLLREIWKIDEDRLRKCSSPRSIVTAYWRMTDHMEELNPFLDNISGPKSEERWSKLVFQISNEIPKLEEILLNHRTRIEGEHWDIEEEDSRALVTHIFRIVNFFTKHNLLGKSFLKSWIEKEEVQEKIIKHIVDMSKDSDLLDVDFRESLSKSKSTEHLAFFLKCFKESLWRKIEFECIQNKISHSETKEFFEKPMPEIIEIVKNFHIFEFENSDIDQVDKKAKFVEKIMDHIEKLKFLGLGPRRYLTCGILYEMMVFVTKYDTKLFMDCFENEKTTQAFSLKMHFLDFEIRLLRIARDIEFVGLNGLWTTEANLMNSYGGISLVQASHRNYVEKYETEYFKEKFDCHVKQDYENWTKLFENSALHKKTSSDYTYPICLGLEFQSGSFTGNFGTNFNVNEDLSSKKKYKIKSLSQEKQISPLFFTELYNSIENINFLHEKFEKNKEMFAIFIKDIFSKDESIPEDFKDWIKHSAFPKTVFAQISEKFGVFEYVWLRIDQKLKLLNEHIIFSVENQKPLKKTHGLFKTFSSSYNELGNNRGLYIPEFNFVDKLPDLDEWIIEIQNQ